MRWPWDRRAEQAHREAEEADRERREATVPLTERAELAIREAVRHRREDNFQAAIEELMRRQA